MSCVEKILSYIAYSEECQVQALSASGDEFKLEYLKLAVSWVDLADERRKFLIEAKRLTPKNSHH